MRFQSEQVIRFSSPLHASHRRNKKTLSFTQSILESFIVKKARLTRFFIKTEENFQEKMSSSPEKTNLDITMSIS